MSKGLDFDITASFLREGDSLTSCFVSRLFEQNILRNVPVFEKMLLGRRDVRGDQNLPFASNHPMLECRTRGDAFLFPGLPGGGLLKVWEGRGH